MKEVIFMLLVAFFGAGLILGGVYLLAGLPWLLIGTGAVFCAFASVIHRGIFRVV